MKNDEIRSANRKALPKFLLVLAACMVLGGAAGYSAAKYGLDTMAGTMKDAGAENAIMSGSGPSVFGIYTEREIAEAAAGKIRAAYGLSEVYVTQPC